jgi:hypothetical protein
MQPDTSARRILIVVGTTPLPLEFLFDRIVSLGNNRKAHDPRIDKHMFIEGDADELVKWGATFSLYFPRAEHFTVCGEGEAADGLFDMLRMIADEGTPFVVERLR